MRILPPRLQLVHPGNCDAHTVTWFDLLFMWRTVPTQRKTLQFVSLFVILNFGFTFDFEIRL